MKKNTLLAIASLFILSVFFSATSAFASEFPSYPTWIPGDSIFEKNSAKIDSLKIIQIKDGKYYIVCTACPLTENRGYLRINIIDSLSYIDPAIPTNKWIASYVIKKYLIDTRAHRSRAIIKNKRLIVNNSFTETYAVLDGDSLKTQIIKNVARNTDRNARQSGTAALLFMFFVGAVFTIILYYSRASLWLNILLTFLCPLLFGLLLNVIFVSSLEATVIAITCYIVGAAIARSLPVVFKNLRRK